MCEEKIYKLLSRLIHINFVEFHSLSFSALYFVVPTTNSSNTFTGLRSRQKVRVNISTNCFFIGYILIYSNVILQILIHSELNPPRSSESSTVIRRLMRSRS